ncbi:MAG: hypothetical protein GY789_21295 [Hyphomicrobiales bacterium]|nr:hypothetical protein [Hyphomicrobiales bacterium]
MKASRQLTRSGILKTVLVATFCLLAISANLVSAAYACEPDPLSTAKWFGEGISAGIREQTDVRFVNHGCAQYGSKVRCTFEFDGSIFGQVEAASADSPANKVEIKVTDSGDYGLFTIIAGTAFGGLEAAETYEHVKYLAYVILRRNRFKNILLGSTLIGLRHEGGHFIFVAKCE